MISTSSDHTVKSTYCHLPALSSNISFYLIPLALHPFYWRSSTYQSIMHSSRHVLPYSTFFFLSLSFIFGRWKRMSLCNFLYLLTGCVKICSIISTLLKNTAIFGSRFFLRGHFIAPLKAIGHSNRYYEYWKIFICWLEFHRYFRFYIIIFSYNW